MFAEPIIGVAVFHDATAMCIDVTTSIVVPQLTRADSLSFLLLLIPVLLQSLRLGLGDMDDGAVLGRREIGYRHLSLTKVTQWREGLEV